jgi:hypothetical protein
MIGGDGKAFRPHVLLFHIILSIPYALKNACLRPQSAYGTALTLQFRLNQYTPFSDSKNSDQVCSIHLAPFLLQIVDHKASMTMVGFMFAAEEAALIDDISCD